MQQPRHEWAQAARCVHQGTFAEPVVLVVENSPDTQRRLVSVMNRAFPNGSVLAAGRVSESRDILLMQPVDIAVIDPDLPDGCGIELIRECFVCSPLTRCVITTTHVDDACLVQALAAGALGYLLDDQPDTVLVQQLRLVADGVPPLAPLVARRLVQYFTAGTAVPPVQQTPEHDGLAQLSGREKQVLCLIAKGMQISEVAHLLEITPNTVCSHIKSIYRKRNVSSRAEAALEAKRLGLV